MPSPDDKKKLEGLTGILCETTRQLLGLESCLVGRFHFGSESDFVTSQFTMRQLVEEEMRNNPKPLKSLVKEPPTSLHELLDACRGLTAALVVISNTIIAQITVCYPRRPFADAANAWIDEYRSAYPGLLDAGKIVQAQWTATLDQASAESEHAGITKH